jgi:hypothetical protein
MRLPRSQLHQPLIFQYRSTFNSKAPAPTPSKRSVIARGLFQNSGFENQTTYSSSRIRQPLEWNPVNGPGPLDQKIANSFRSSIYTELFLPEDTIFYRVYTRDEKASGKYWSRIAPSGPLQSIIDHALHPKFGNFANKTIKIVAPAGTRVFEGTVAPQHSLIGGGNQIFIPEVKKEWILQ